MTFSFDMTEDPARFEEAVEEFARRRVVTREEADALEGYARKRVWWISGVAQMDIVQDAHESIVKAMADGVSFEDWKKEIGPKLEKAWGRKDGHRILTIFRNATHQAYAAGRERQMRDPDVLALRPYHEFVAVEDLSECEVCAKCNGVIRLADDPWWFGHTPQLHHCCRCQKRSLRAKTALGRGITPVPPEVTADEGFGQLPEDSMPPKPVERKEPPDPAIHRELYLKQERDQKVRKPRKVKLKKEHDPEHWVESYERRYGAAARPMAYGKAVAERAKALSSTEASAILKSLDPATPGVAWLSEALRSDDPVQSETARLLLQHAQLAGTYSPGISLPSGHKLRTKARLVDRFFRTFAKAGLEVPGGVRWRFSVKRGSFAWLPLRPDQGGTISYDGDPRTGVHEFAHAIEMASPRARRAIQAFFAVRTAGYPTESIRKLTGRKWVGLDEMCKRDEFADAYIGKLTPGDSSEVLSTAAGWMVSGEFVKIVRDDPEMAHLVLGVLAGWF